MIIDFHTHIYPNKIADTVVRLLTSGININPAYDGTCAGLINSMEKNGVDKSVCLPIVVDPKNTISINNYVIEVSKLYKDKLICFGGIHPLYEDNEAILKELKENGIKGIKLHPVYQNVSVDSKEFIDTINLCFKYGFIVTIHAGKDPGYPGNDMASSKRIVQMLNKIDKGTLILAHMGGFKESEYVYEHICGLDVYLDTAFEVFEIKYTNGEKEPFIDKDLYYKMIKKHGSDKILFGTDLPWQEFKDIYNDFSELDLTDEERDNILYKNALRILDV